MTSEDVNKLIKMRGRRGTLEIKEITSKCFILLTLA